jgi:hypothetical protein
MIASFGAPQRAHSGLADASRFARHRYAPRSRYLRRAGGITLSGLRRHGHGGVAICNALRAVLHLRNYSEISGHAGRLRPENFYANRIILIIFLSYILIF